MLQRSVCLAALVVVLAAACTGDGNQASEVPSPDLAVLPLAPGPGAMLALDHGELQYRDGCLLLKGPAGGKILLWPDGFRLVSVQGEPAVLDADGHEVVRVGEEVSVGGGNLPRILGDAAIREADLGCFGQHYWAVG